MKAEDKLKILSRRLLAVGRLLAEASERLELLALAVADVGTELRKEGDRVQR